METAGVATPPLSSSFFIFTWWFPTLLRHIPPLELLPAFHSCVRPRPLRHRSPPELSLALPVPPFQTRAGATGELLPPKSKCTSHQRASPFVRCHNAPHRSRHCRCRQRFLPQCFLFHHNMELLPSSIYVWNGESPVGGGTAASTSLSCATTVPGEPPFTVSPPPNI